MYYFCTYFDQNYLPRGLALSASLQEHCPEFTLWVLCMDAATYESLTQLDLPEIKPIALPDFEKGDEPLLQAKQNRSLVEYYFTCTPSLPLYILNNFPEVNLITYLDADLFFFADPAPIYEETADSSIAIIAHGFRPELKNLEIYGVYNVGWLSFRRDQNALTCLHWWRERCIEWCYDRPEGGRFADQKYLDHWPDLFNGVVVLRHKGGNLAPWNASNYVILQRANALYVDNQQLIFYHFHGLRPITNWLYNPGFSGYDARPSKVVVKHIYQPYIRMLLEIDSKNVKGSRKKASRSRALQVFRTIRDSLAGKYILVVEGLPVIRPH